MITDKVKQHNSKLLGLDSIVKDTTSEALTKTSLDRQIFALTIHVLL
ncbi:hypothetical protein [Candidatus Pseudomonas adelgestsugas]|nr:hypothetical protein [Candidatus Pseudomonas adelgestsugas]